MKIIKEYTINHLFFDNSKSNPEIELIDLNGETISVDYNSIIDTQFSGGNTSKEINKLRKKLNLSGNSKSPCGGFINFYSLKGDKGNTYVVYSGVNEVSNSHYIVTIHKIFKE